MAVRLAVPGENPAEPGQLVSETQPASRTIASGSDHPPTSTQPIVSRLARDKRFVPTVRRFAVRLEEQLAALDQAASNHDFAEIAALAHWLKGAAGTVGYDAFTEPATQLEQHAKAEAETQIRPLLSVIRELSKRLAMPDKVEEAKVLV